MQIVIPHVEYLAQAPVRAVRPATLDGRAVGFLDGWSVRQADGSYSMYPLMAELKRLLEARFRLSECIWVRKARAGSPPTPEQMDTLVLRCAAVITGVGLSGGSTAGAAHDAATLERRGVPTVTICYAGYEAAAQMYARALGVQDLALLSVPSPLAGNVSGDVRQIAEESFERVLAALVEPA